MIHGITVTRLIKWLTQDKKHSLGDYLSDNIERITNEKYPENINFIESRGFLVILNQLISACQ
jgi:DNA topoisomerase VI subunit B